MRRAFVLGLTLLAMGATCAPAGALPLPLPPLGLPALQPAPPADFFGLGAEHVNLRAALRDSDLDRQAATGVTTMRENIRWDEIERSPGKYDFSKLDAVVGGMAKRHIRMLPDLIYAPDFYTDKPAGAPASVHYPPKDPAKLAAFARRIVRRYGNNGTFWCGRLGLIKTKNCGSPYLPVQTWQVWNEPDYPAWWGGHPDAAQYAALLKAVTPYIHRADRRAKVLAAGMTNKVVTSGYLDRFYDAAVKGSFDAFGFHPYASTVADVIVLIRQLRNEMVQRGDVTKPIVLTEYGWADGGARSTLIVSSNCQAAMIYAVTRRLSDLRTELGLGAIYDFYWTNQPGAANGSWPLFAGLVRLDGSAKPALAAFTAAVKGQPVPDGLTLPAACPPDRQSV